MKLSLANLPNTITCPTSKSYAARALILAALKNKSTTIWDLPSAQDTKDLISVLKFVGLEFAENQNQLTILNSFPACEKNEYQELNLGEGGTTIRFLLPLLALGRQKYRLYYEGRMNDRPMEELYRALSSLGAEVEVLANGISIQGPIDLTKSIEVDCSKTTQFASGLTHLQLLGDFKVKYENLNHSRAYLEMSKKLVTHYKQNDEFTVPADFSGLGYILAYAIFHQDILINNIKQEDELQADNEIFNIMKQIGVKFEFTRAGLEIKQLEHFNSGFEIDGSLCIDLVPTLTFIASYLPFESKIKNISNLIYKESDRLAEIMKILGRFKVKHSYDETQDILLIQGVTKKVDEISYICPNDHRMVMLVSLFLKQNSGGEIMPESAINKSFPEFFDYFH